ncbi:HAD-like domain-containing protein [Mycena galericulata]|nr:HAD-like domain-containing protein [Mycena galericulata]
MSLSFKTIIVDAILTLLDSTPGLVKAWTTFCSDYSLGDPAVVVHETHGRRLYDTLKEYCLIDDTDKLQVEIDRFEEEVINGGPLALPGVLPLLSQLSSESALGWTIVTSATRNYAPRALESCSIPLPRAGIVTSSDVSRGKPHADPGIRSGKAAGALVLAVCTSTPRETIAKSDSEPDYIVTDLTKVSARWANGKVEVTIVVEEFE